MVPFAYRTHTHKLGKINHAHVNDVQHKLNFASPCLTGKVVSGYKVTTDSNGKNTWTLLGRRDPNTPQMFYPIESNVTVKYGDSLVFFNHAKFKRNFGAKIHLQAARCTMASDRDFTTQIGYVCFL